MARVPKKGQAHSTLRPLARQHRNPQKDEIQTVIEADATPTDEFILPDLLIPRRKDGKSLSELVSEGRR